MIEILKTDTVDKWFRGLRDVRAKARIDERIERLARDNPGDVKPVGRGETSAGRRGWRKN